MNNNKKLGENNTSRCVVALWMRKIVSQQQQPWCTFKKLWYFRPTCGFNEYSIRNQDVILSQTLVQYPLLTSSTLLLISLLYFFTRSCALFPQNWHFIVKEKIRIARNAVSCPHMTDSWHSH
jgi:hypothetical protein